MTTAAHSQNCTGSASMSQSGLEPFDPPQLQGWRRQQQQQQQDHPHRRPQHRHSDAASDPFLVTENSPRAHTKSLPTPPLTPPIAVATTVPPSLPSCARSPAAVPIPLPSRPTTVPTANRTIPPLTTHTTNHRRQTPMSSLVHRSAMTELLLQQSRQDRDDKDGGNSSSETTERGEADEASVEKSTEEVNGSAEVSTRLAVKPNIVNPSSKARERLRKDTSISRKFSASPNGLPLPIQIGKVLVMSLGVVDYPRSYNTRGSAHIWPVGFTSRRRYNAVRGDPQRYVWFESTILEHPEKENECLFRIRQIDTNDEDHHGNSDSRMKKDREWTEDVAEFTGPSPRAAWLQVMTRVSEILKIPCRPNCNGLAFMALSDTKIQASIANSVPEHHWKKLGLQNPHPYLCEMRERYKIPNGKQSSSRPVKRVKSTGSTSPTDVT